MSFSMDPRKVYDFIDLINKNQFRKFAKVSLKLTAAEIEEAECRHPGSVTEQKYEMVQQWHMKTGFKAKFELLEQLYSKFCDRPIPDEEGNLPCPSTATPVDHPRQSQAPSGDTSGTGTPPSNTSASLTRTQASQLNQPASQPTKTGNKCLLDVECRNSHDAGNTVQNQAPPSDMRQQCDRPSGSSVRNPPSDVGYHNARGYGNTAQNQLVTPNQCQSSENGDIPDGQDVNVSFVTSSESLYSTYSEEEVQLKAQNKATVYDNPLGAVIEREYFNLCNTVPSTVEVDDCPKNIARHLNKNREYYPILDKSYKGYIFIFNNMFKGNAKHTERKGSEIDVKNLKKLWKEIGGCKVIEKHNLSAEKIKSEFKKFVTSKAKKDCGFVAFFVMSHGNCDYYMKDGKLRKGEGYFLGNDGNEVMIEDILVTLRNSYPNTTLKEIPRLIFFQTCRGDRLGKGIEATTTPGRVETEFSAQSSRSASLDGSTSETGDILQGYATQPGYKAMRDRNTGTWYINAIVNVFRQYAKTHHVLELLTKVNDAVDKMSADLGDGTPSKEETDMNCSLGRFLHLFPGQENEEY